MQRTTISIDNDLLAQLDAFAEERGYANRSEAMRDLVRSGLEQSRLRSQPDEHCVAAAIYVYDHEARELSRRLTRVGHEHHDLSLATLHVHLDHESCLEINVLRGLAAEVRHFADHVIAERGVRHGRLVMVPVESNVETHDHGQAGSGARPHLHLHRTRRRR
jgi:CopG family nickel-responsive transcriptional regulator